MDGGMNNLKNVLRKPYHLIKKVIRPERPMPPKWSNFNYNKTYWDRYAKTWNKFRDPVDNPEVAENHRETYIKYLGDEWGKVSDVEKVVEEYIYPSITKESVIAEIGVGGGRIAAKVADRPMELVCFDISAEMIKKAKSAISSSLNVSYVLLEKPKFPEKYSGYFDFIYSFDVFVHLDLHTMWKYFTEIHNALKAGGKAFIHTTNLKSPGGWERFASQEDYDPQYHYFISPEIVDILAQHSNFRIVKSSKINSNNFYLYRDYLVILEKK
jgi:SAM-dependent methyltransferase